MGVAGVMTVVTEGCTMVTSSWEDREVLQMRSELWICRVRRVTRKKLAQIPFIHVSLWQRCEEAFCKNARKTRSYPFSPE